MRRSRSPARRAASPASKARPAAITPFSSGEQLKQLSAKLADEREKLGLLSQPLRTLVLFTAALSDFLLTTVAPHLVSRPMLLFGYPTLLAYAGSRQRHPDLYAPPVCGGGGAAGALYYPELLAYETAWWLVLGVLSSIGFGSGLHSGIMFLWPFVMQVVLKAEATDSTHFIAIYNHPCVLRPLGTPGDGSNTFLSKLLLVWPSVIAWGVGTALGELPPYFITRAARRTGKRDETFEAELQEARKATDIISRLKVRAPPCRRRTPPPCRRGSAPPVAVPQASPTLTRARHEAGVDNNVH